MQNTSEKKSYPTTNKELVHQLKELAEPSYKEFASSLLPGIGKLLGVRLPVLRKLAKQLAGRDWKLNMTYVSDGTFEEILLRGMIIGYAKAPLQEILEQVSVYVPVIDNWSVCDSFCITLKIVKDHREEVWEYLQAYLNSTKEFEARFGIVMLLDYFIDDQYVDRVLEALEHVVQEDYYARMAVAWALSMCFVHFPRKTLDCLSSGRLDDFTYNKTLQKITESHSVDKDMKKEIKSKRRITG